MSKDVIVTPAGNRIAAHSSGRLERPTDPGWTGDAYGGGAMNANQAAAYEASNQAHHGELVALEQAERDRLAREERRRQDALMMATRTVARGPLVGTPAPTSTAPSSSTQTTGIAGYGQAIGTFLGDLPPIEVDIGVGSGGGVGINIGTPIPGVGDGRPVPPTFEQPRTQPTGGWPNQPQPQPGVFDAVGGPVVVAAGAIVVTLVAVGGAVLAMLSKAK